MEFGNGWVEGCAPSDKYRHMVVEQFLTVPSGNASITEVDSKTEGQLEVKDYSLLIDPPDGESIGFVKFPPTSPSWDQIKPVSGTTIPAGASAFLVAEIKTTGPSGGKLAGSTIHYQVGGKEFEATTKNSFEISAQCED